jgi:MFS family permease
MVGAVCLAFVSLAVIIYFPINTFVLYLAFICLGMGASGQSIGFATIAEQCKPSYRAAGLGVNNLLIMLSVAIGSPMVSSVLNILTDGKKAVIHDYEISLSILLGFTAIGIIISVFFIRETFCRSTKEIIMLN